MWNVAVERQIQVIGPDAEEFVDYVITRNAKRIEPMHAKYVILCNEQGGVLNDPVLLRPSENEFWFSLADSDIMFWLQGVNVGKGYNVEIAEIDVKYKAKTAERKIFLEKSLADTLASGDEEGAEKIRRQIAEETTSMEEDAERAKERVRKR